MKKLILSALLMSSFNSYSGDRRPENRRPTAPHGVVTLRSPIHSERQDLPNGQYFISKYVELKVKEDTLKANEYPSGMVSILCDSGDELISGTCFIVSGQSVEIGNSFTNESAREEIDGEVRVGLGWSCGYQAKGLGNTDIVVSAICREAASK